MPSTFSTERLQRPTENAAQIARSPITPNPKGNPAEENNVTRSVWRIRKGTAKYDGGARRDSCGVKYDLD